MNLNTANEIVDPYPSMWVGDRMPRTDVAPNPPATKQSIQQLMEEVERQLKMAHLAKQVFSGVPAPDAKPTKNYTRVEWVKEYREIANSGLQEALDLSHSLWADGEEFDRAKHPTPRQAYEKRSVTPVSAPVIVQASANDALQKAIDYAIGEAFSKYQPNDKYKAALEMMAKLFDLGQDEAAKILCKSMVEEAK